MSAFREDDARLAGMHGYPSVGPEQLRASDELMIVARRLDVLEAKLDALVAGLRARGSL